MKPIHDSQNHMGFLRHGLKIIQFIVFTLFTVFLLSSSGLAWSGKCVGISDGDTISVMHDGKAEKIRLDGIDCPESAQPFGRKAKQFTSNFAYGKTTEIVPLDTDHYGRTIAKVFIDGQCLNAELLKAGFAWHYKKYSSSKDLALYETRARAEKLGLWSDSNPIAPWDWRGGKVDISQNQSISNRETVSEKAIIYHGNTSSHIFHRPGCRHYNCKNCTAVFHTREDAINAGYRPCKICRP